MTRTWVASQIEPLCGYRGYGTLVIWGVKASLTVHHGHRNSYGVFNVEEDDPAPREGRERQPQGSLNRSRERCPRHDLDHVLIASSINPLCCGEQDRRKAPRVTNKTSTRSVHQPTPSTGSLKSSPRSEDSTAGWVWLLIGKVGGNVVQSFSANRKPHVEGLGGFQRSGRNVTL